MIDAASLPEDLIPTAWTMLSDAPGVDCVNGSSLSGLHDGRYWMAGRPALSSVEVRKMCSWVCPTGADRIMEFRCTFLDVSGSSIIPCLSQSPALYDLSKAVTYKAVASV